MLYALLTPHSKNEKIVKKKFVFIYNDSGTHNKDKTVISNKTVLGQLSDIEMIASR